MKNFFKLKDEEAKRINNRKQSDKRGRFNLFSRNDSRQQKRRDLLSDQMPLENPVISNDYLSAKYKK